jgi:hypothetical protein
MIDTLDKIYSCLDDLGLDESAVNIIHNRNSTLVELDMNTINKRYSNLEKIISFIDSNLKKIGNVYLISKEYILTEEEVKDLGEELGIDWSSVEFTPRDLQMGFEVELEHGFVGEETNVTDDDIFATAKIAWAHLKELPDYYTRLLKMENAACKQAKKQYRWNAMTKAYESAQKILAEEEGSTEDLIRSLLSSSNLVDIKVHVDGDTAQPNDIVHVSFAQWKEEETIKENLILGISSTSEQEAMDLLNKIIPEDLRKLIKGGSEIPFIGSVEILFDDLLALVDLIK